MKKELNHLNLIKSDFTTMLEKVMQLKVIGTNIKHKVDMGRSDVIKFTVKIENDAKFIYVYVNRSDKRTIQISTDISNTFLDELSSQLMHKDADSIINHFKSGFLSFASKYNLFSSSQFSENPFFNSDFGFIKSYSSSSYFYAMKNYSTHFINARLYDTRNEVIMISTKIMFYYNNNTFIAYPYMKLKFGRLEHDIHLYSRQNMRKDLDSVLKNLKTEIYPFVKSIFNKLFAIELDEEAFFSIKNEEFERNLAVLSMYQI